MCSAEAGPKPVLHWWAIVGLNAYATESTNPSRTCHQHRGSLPSIFTLAAIDEATRQVAVNAGRALRPETMARGNILVFDRGLGIKRPITNTREPFVAACRRLAEEPPVNVGRAESRRHRDPARSGAGNHVAQPPLVTSANPVAAAPSLPTNDRRTVRGRLGRLMRPTSDPRQDDRDEDRGTVTINERAVEARVTGCAPLALGTDAEVVRIAADVAARQGRVRAVLRQSFPDLPAGRCAIVRRCVASSCCWPW